MINAAAIYIYDKVVRLLDGLIVGVSGFFRGLGYGRVRRIAPWESMHYAKVMFFFKASGLFSWVAAKQVFSFCKGFSI